MINPARLRTAPRSLPQTLKSRPTTLKTTTKNIIANKIGVQPPPTYFLFHLTLCFTINICQSASLTDDSIAIFLPFVNLIILPFSEFFSMTPAPDTPTQTAILPPFYGTSPAPHIHAAGSLHASFQPLGAVHRRECDRIRLRPPLRRLPEQFLLVRVDVCKPLVKGLETRRTFF